jgi:hypothetical protein
MMADIIKNALSNIQEQAKAEQASKTNVAGTGEVSIQGESSTTETGTTQTTTITPSAPIATTTTTVTTPTATPTTETSQTTTQQGDQSTEAAVTTPTTPTASGTTGVTTTTPESGVSSQLASELYTSNPIFNDYATKSGYVVQNIDGKVYVNNSLVDWQKLGMTYKDGKLYGTQAQYDQMLEMVKQNGYTTGDTFSEYLLNSGYKVSRSSDGKYILINGIPCDPSQYDGMTKLNGNWVGTAAAYQAMIQETMQPTKADPDYLASTEFADYARKKGYEVKKDPNGYGMIVNGYTCHMEKYKSLKFVNGKIVGSEADYRQMIMDSFIYSRQGMDQYITSKGYDLKTDPKTGYMMISEKGKNNWRAIHAAYWQGIEGEPRFNRWAGKWFASEEVYDQIIQEALSRSDYSLEEYAKVTGLKTGRDAVGNLTIDGKSIPGTADTGTYSAGSAKYYNDLVVVNGVFVGSEDTYRQILSDLASRSDKTFNDYATTNNNTVTVMNDKIYINGNLVDTTGTSLQIVNGQVWGSEADYKALIEKADAGYEYTSPYEDQIQAALAEIQDFESYQTPQETLDQINALMESAKEQFNYDPTKDSALKTAQKEAERVVREASGSRGMLYSSGTIANVAKKAGELIPTYEQQAYNRWSDQKNRESNLLQVIMDWDEMQSQRNVDQLNLIKTKFDTVMDMDSRTLEQFRVMLDQKNADRSAALELESLNLEITAQELDIAWKRTEALGYVDQAASVILGVPVGTKASWVQQAALTQKNALEQARVNNEYTKQLQSSQANIEKSLVEYKVALDEATQKRVLAQQYSNEKSLARQNYANQLAIAKKYG